ncbi:HMA2 domain-containing protein [Selenomonas massiliensis]|uniref:HMA2 domain-containing protein n=1 Tax=Selenomonas massiliensis TaxID=2058293 RepID=UPI00389AFF2E
MGGGASLLSTGLLGGGRGGASSPLTSLFSTMGRAGGAQPFSSGGGGGRMGRQSAQEEASASAPLQPQAKATTEPPFTCVHASPGRRRYRTPYLTKEFAAVLEECLARLPFVLSVRANAVSGSILLTYLPEDEAHIVVLAEGLQAIFSEGRTAPPPATLAQSVRRSVHDFSGWIQRHTGGALDLSSVVAGIFVLRGIRQLVLTNNTPSGSQMLWWALTLMRGWKV